MTRTIEVRTELEPILVEQALALARELELASDAAPDGHVLTVSELAALRAGRELTRVAMEATLRRQPAPAEHFPNAERVQDIFNASQHLAASSGWLDGSRLRLPADGWSGLLNLVGASASEGLWDPPDAA